jgi:hypothetical protein
MFMERSQHDGNEIPLCEGKNINQEEELSKLREEAKRRNMRMLTKDKSDTWSNGSTSTLKPSNLDHVVAANHLKLSLEQHDD